MSGRLPDRPTDRCRVCDGPVDGSDPTIVVTPAGAFHVRHVKDAEGVDEAREAAGSERQSGLGRF